MKLIVKYFLLSDILVLGGHLRFGSKHFPLAGMFYMGCCLRLRVLLCSDKYGNNVFIVRASVHKNFSRKFIQVRFQVLVAVTVEVAVL
jgi:hypothetical protein